MSLLTKISRSYAALFAFLAALLLFVAVLVVGAIHIPRGESRFVLCVLCLPVAGFSGGVVFSLAVFEIMRRRS